ncbi:periplasmic heavy metal sensor [uncultured Desulfovibrio sp.]|uniref:periplasmic heavy metal sensor n=1 Tax=uncultured Desulfovibrio sp. TaxID=167968 RepID=UPI002632CAB8|nr:periplasmic heavy metal sensor [uncultured Desulfovibrio sp.]
MDGKMGGCGMMGGSEMGPMMSHMGMGAIHPGMIKHIKGQLKPEQMAQFDAALKDYSKKIEPTQQALFVKHEELKALQHATNPDVKAVSKTATEFAQLVSKLKSEREAFEDKITKDFGIKDLHGGMMGGMKDGGMMGGMKHDAMGQTPPAAAADQAPAGHEGHKQ